MNFQGNIAALGAITSPRYATQVAAITRVPSVRRLDEAGTGVDARTAQADLVTAVQQVGVDRVAGLSQAALDATGKTLSVLEEMQALADAASRATTPAFFRNSLAESLAKAAERLDAVAKSAEVDGTNVADGSTAGLGVDLGATKESQALIDLTTRGLGLDGLDVSSEAGGQKARAAIGAALGALKAQASALGRFHGAVAKAAEGAQASPEPTLTPERARAVAAEAREALPTLGQAVLGQGRPAAHAVASLLR